MTAPRVSVDEAALRRVDALSVDPSTTLAELAVSVYTLLATREPIPPALSAAAAAALADDLIACAAPYDDRTGWRDRDNDALAASRDAIIAALTGRALAEAALAEAEARGRAAALAEVDAAIVRAASAPGVDGHFSANVQDDAVDIAFHAGVDDDGYHLFDHRRGMTFTAAILAAAALTGREGGAA